MDQGYVERQPCDLVTVTNDGEFALPVRERIDTEEDPAEDPEALPYEDYADLEAPDVWVR